MVQDSMAGSLHLATQQISAQLKEGKSMTDIAAAQGVSADQLRTIELQAFQDAFNQGVKSGDLDPKYSGYWMQQFQNDPQLLNKMALIQWMR
jgi:hypothetical protein